MKRSVLILFLAVSLLLAACAPAQTTPPVAAQSPTKASEANTSNENANTKSSSLTRVDDQGAVTVEVTPINLDQPGDMLQFNVVMDTHSVDLSMDLKTLSTLTTDTGISLQAAKWDAPSGGHHVEGKLSFPAAQSGKSILEDAKSLTLTITGVDNATRTFNWDLTAK